MWKNGLIAEKKRRALTKTRLHGIMVASTPTPLGTLMDTDFSAATHRNGIATPSAQLYYNTFRFSCQWGLRKKGGRKQDDRRGAPYYLTSAE